MCLYYTDKYWNCFDFGLIFSLFGACLHGTEGFCRKCEWEVPLIQFVIVFFLMGVIKSCMTHLFRTKWSSFHHPMGRLCSLTCTLCRGSSHFMHVHTLSSTPVKLDGALFFSSACLICSVDQHQWSHCHWCLNPSVCCWTTPKPLWLINYSNTTTDPVVL